MKIKFYYEQIVLLSEERALLFEKGIQLRTSQFYYEKETPI